MSYSNPLSDKSEMLRVGIVDDSLFIRQVIRQVINDTKGMSVVGEAADPYEAREMIKAANPDIITLDIEMPRMTGFDLVEAVRKEDEIKDMPMIALTTRYEDADIKKGLDLGFNYYLEKFKKEEILKAIKESLA